MALQAINPATGETVQTYDEMTPAAVSETITQAHTTFQDWKQTPFAERARMMQRAAHILREHANEYAVLMAQEMGKPIRDGRAEAEKCAWVCEYYAEQAEAFLQPEIIPTDATKSFVTFQPLGVVLAVMPWNFPFWQVFRFAAPALMAGNTGVLKHASNVPGCALAIEEVFRQAGFPAHLFRTLLIGSRHVDAVIEHPLVKAVTLTGSTPAGKAVASKAGEMLKKTVLELGGSDAYVVLDDADLEATATTCVASRLINAGQSCIAAKRFMVVDVHPRTVQERLLSTQMRAAQVGDPMEEQTQVGPMARHDLRDELHQQVQASMDRGLPACWAGQCLRVRAPTIHRPCSPMSPKACRPTMTSCLDLWRRLLPFRTSTKPSAWPTIPCLAWARRCSRRMWPKVNTSPPMNWRLAVVLSTPS